MWQGLHRLTAGVLAAMLVCLTSGPNAGAQAQGPFVVLQTTKGPIVMKIFYNYVPNTAGNFLDLVSRGFYNGLTFHRVEGWVIQGGDPNGNGTGDFIDPATGRPRYLKLETNRFLKHNAPGVVAMAHAKNPNSGSCQFYITKRAMPALDGQYSIFGGVVKGMEVVYAIQPGDRIISAEIIQPAGAAAPGGSGAGGTGEPQPGQPVGDSGF